MLTAQGASGPASVRGLFAAARRDASAAVRVAGSRLVRQQSSTEHWGSYQGASNQFPMSFHDDKSVNIDRRGLGKNALPRTWKPKWKPTGQNPLEAVIRLEHYGGARVVYVNGPRAGAKKAVNRLDIITVKALAEVLTQLESNPAVTMVTVRGASDAVFCSGTDAAAFAARCRDPATRDIALTYMRAMYGLQHLVANYTKPLVVGMHGVTLGTGYALAANARFTYVVNNAAVAVPEVTQGLVPHGGATYHLARAPGGLGMYMATTGGVLSGEEAFWGGLAPHYGLTGSGASGDFPGGGWSGAITRQAGDLSLSPTVHWDLATDPVYKRALAALRLYRDEGKMWVVLGNMHEDVSQEQLDGYLQLKRWYTYMAVGDSASAAESMDERPDNDFDLGDLFDFHYGQEVDGRDILPEPAFAAAERRARIAATAGYAAAIGRGALDRGPSLQTVSKLRVIREAFGGSEAKGDPVLAVSHDVPAPRRSREQAQAAALAAKPVLPADWETRIRVPTGASSDAPLPRTAQAGAGTAVFGGEHSPLTGGGPLQAALLVAYERTDLAPAAADLPTLTNALRVGVARAWPTGALADPQLEELLSSLAAPNTPETRHVVSRGIAWTTAQLLGEDRAARNPWVLEDPRLAQRERLAAVRARAAVNAKYKLIVDDPSEEQVRDRDERGRVIVRTETHRYQVPTPPHMYQHPEEWLYGGDTEQIAVALKHSTNSGDSDIADLKLSVALTEAEMVQQQRALPSAERGTAAGPDALWPEGGDLRFRILRLLQRMASHTQGFTPAELQQMQQQQAQAQGGAADAATPTSSAGGAGASSGAVQSATAAASSPAEGVSGAVAAAMAAPSPSPASVQVGLVDPRTLYEHALQRAAAAAEGSDDVSGRRHEALRAASRLGIRATMSEAAVAGLGSDARAVRRLSTARARAAAAEAARAAELARWDAELAVVQRDLRAAEVGPAQADAELAAAKVDVDAVVNSPALDSREEQAARALEAWASGGVEAKEPGAPERVSDAEAAAEQAALAEQVPALQERARLLRNPQAREVAGKSAAAAAAASWSPRQAAEAVLVKLRYAYVKHLVALAEACPLDPELPDYVLTADAEVTGTEPSEEAEAAAHARAREAQLAFWDPDAMAEMAQLPLEHEAALEAVELRARSLRERRTLRLLRRYRALKGMVDTPLPVDIEHPDETAAAEATEMLAEADGADADAVALGLYKPQAVGEPAAEAGFPVDEGDSSDEDEAPGDEEDGGSIDFSEGGLSLVTVPPRREMLSNPLWGGLPPALATLVADALGEYAHAEVAASGGPTQLPALLAAVRSADASATAGVRSRYALVSGKDGSVGLGLLSLAQAEGVAQAEAEELLEYQAQLEAVVQEAETVLRAERLDQTVTVIDHCKAVLAADRKGLPLPFYPDSDSDTEERADARPAPQQGQQRQGSPLDALSAGPEGAAVRSAVASVMDTGAGAAAAAAAAAEPAPRSALAGRRPLLSTADLPGESDDEEGGASGGVEDAATLSSALAGLEDAGREAGDAEEYLRTAELLEATGRLPDEDTAEPPVWDAVHARRAMTEPAFLRAAFDLPKTRDTTAAAARVVDHYISAAEGTRGVVQARSVEEIRSRLRAIAAEGGTAAAAAAAAGGARAGAADRRTDSVGQREAAIARETLAQLEALPAPLVRSVHALLVRASTRSLRHCMVGEYRALARVASGSADLAAIASADATPGSIADALCAPLRGAAAGSRAELVLPRRKAYEEQIAARSAEVAAWTGKLTEAYEGGMHTGALGDVMRRRYRWIKRCLTPGTEMAPFDFESPDDEADEEAGGGDEAVHRARLLGGLDDAVDEAGMLAGGLQGASDRDIHRWSAEIVRRDVGDSSHKLR